MESAARHLRTSQSQEIGKAQILLVQDSLQVMGGRAAFCKVLAKLCQHMSQAEARNHRIVVLALQEQPQLYRQMVSTGNMEMLSVVDCHTDSYGWLRPFNEQASAATWRLGKGLVGLQQAVDAHLDSDSEDLAQQKAAHYVFIDSLDHLLQHAALAEVVRYLQDLGSHPAVLGICMQIHEDLHTPQVLAAVTMLCTGSLQLHGLHGLRKESAMHAAPAKQAPHGELQLHLKRHTGRVKIETEMFILSDDGDMETFTPPSEAITAQLLAARAVHSGENCSDSQPSSVNIVKLDTAAHEALLTSQAGLKLTLTDQEREARQAVILPYEHQGSSQQYQTADFRDYLPHSAGGQGKGVKQGALGHIMYVRDSESEHDSDEDPDDDLDI